MKEFLLAMTVVALAATGCNRESTSTNVTSSSATNASTEASTESSRLTPTSRENQPSMQYGTNESVAGKYDANNTGRNVRDRSDASLTAQDQGGSAADRELTRKLRSALTDNDQLSADGKNIKIITRDGKVTLRGPVSSEQEKNTIASILQQQGVTSVDNLLEVKQPNQ